MATYTRLPSGQWRAQIRRAGHSAFRPFRLEADAEAWVCDREGRID